MSTVTASRIATTTIPKTFNQAEFTAKITELLDKQRAFFNSDATKSIDFRLEQINKLQKLIKNNEKMLHEAIYNDFGKSEFDSKSSEIFPVHDEIRNLNRKLHRWARPRRVATSWLNFPSRNYIVPEPLGISLVIGAWNFPYNLSLLPVVGSMMAGNTTILKPSEIAAHTSQAMATLINENFAPEYLNVVEGGIDETTVLLAQRYDKIFFTGSPKVGKIVNEAAAPHLTNVTLELGGKNPVLISTDSNLEVSAKRIIQGKFLNAGQLCVAPDYVLVHPSQKDELLRLLAAEIKKHKYSLARGNFVQIINDRNFNRLTNLIDPTKVYVGGNYDAETRVIQPTILHNVTLEDAIMQEEIFGPLLPVLTYNTFEEAVEIIKNYEKPLSGYIFSNDRQEIKRFLQNVSFGNGGVNNVIFQVADTNLPFGGVGNSGTGSYHGKYSFDCFSHLKSIVDKPTWLEGNFKYQMHNPRIQKWLKRFL